MIAATTSEAIGSARSNPVRRMTPAATAAAIEPNASIRLCWKAPSTLRLARFARANAQAAPRLAPRPAIPTQRTSPASTSGGSASRRIAS